MRWDSKFINCISPVGNKEGTSSTIAWVSHSHLFCFRSKYILLINNCNKTRRGHRASAHHREWALEGEGQGPSPTVKSEYYSLTPEVEVKRKAWIIAVEEEEEEEEDRGGPRLQDLSPSGRLGHGHPLLEAAQEGLHPLLDAGAHASRHRVGRGGGQAGAGTGWPGVQTLLVAQL